jgi:hypothetical protein
VTKIIGPSGPDELLAAEQDADDGQLPEAGELVHAVPLSLIRPAIVRSVGLDLYRGVGVFGEGLEKLPPSEPGKRDAVLGGQLRDGDVHLHADHPGIEHDRDERRPTPNSLY